VTAPAASLTPEEAAELLGVAMDAPAADVQRAYLRAARRTHPDVLPDVDERARLEAAAAFDRLTRARDLLVAEPGPAAPASPAASRPPASERYRRGRGLGGPLVVLTLLGFLLIGIVAAEQAFIGDPTQVPGVTTTPSP
jgi:hypothetical protein